MEKRITSVRAVKKHLPESYTASSQVQSSSLHTSRYARLGTFYENGEINQSIAFRLYQQAAKAGSKFQLGILYYSRPVAWVIVIKPGAGVGRNSRPSYGTKCLQSVPTVANVQGVNQ